MKNIEEFINEGVLNSDNCSQFLLDAIKFESSSIMEKCQTIMVSEFPKIVSNEKGLKFLMELPANVFTAICSSNNLIV